MSLARLVHVVLHVQCLALVLLHDLGRKPSEHGGSYDDGGVLRMREDNGDGASVGEELHELEIRSLTAYSRTRRSGSSLAGVHMKSLSKPKGGWGEELSHTAYVYSLDIIPATVHLVDDMTSLESDSLSMQWSVS